MKVIERLNLSPDTLLERNPKLVIARVSGFGQDDPYASRPGFASIADRLVIIVVIETALSSEFKIYNWFFLMLTALLFIFLLL